MIIAWIIGIILCSYAIYLYKGTRVLRRDYSRLREPEPLLYVWHVVLYVTFGLIPIANIILGIAMLLVWGAHIHDDDWKYTRKPPFFTILGKPIE